MGEPIFTGRFLQPVEAFSLQNFDPTHLHRLPSGWLFWMLVLAITGLAVHFALSSFRDLRKKRGAQL